VVQKIQRKKPEKGAEYREYAVDSFTIRFPDGTEIKRYTYGPKYESGKFERPIREVYKISIHESRRENGKVVKKQCVLGTVGFYDLVQWGLCDYIDSGISHAMDVFGVDYETLYNLAESKMKLIIDKAKRQYHRSEEYKSSRQREKLQKDYQKRKKQFAAQYCIDADEYDSVYDIHGNLMDEDRLNQIIRQYEQRQEAEKRRYQEYSYRTYNWGSYSIPTASTYNEDETAILKQFYRTLAKTYHPDLNPDRDVTAQMQLLNKLKDQWGV